MKKLTIIILGAILAISVFGCSKAKDSAEDLVDDAKERGIVKVIFAEDFNPLEEKHPIESYLTNAGIAYYFKGERVGQKNDYEIDLTQIKVIYSK